MQRIEPAPPLTRHLAVLEDYDTSERVCGVLFDEAISGAIDSLAVDRVGHGILESLADNINVTERNCLLWRVVAQNQKDAREELEQTLSEADRLKQQVMDALGAGGEAFATGAGYLKKFLDHYRKFDEAQKEAVPSSSSNAALRASGVDRLVVSAGAVLLNRFTPTGAIGDTVGGLLVRHVLHVRAGMDAVESSNLITTHAHNVPEVRRYYAQRVRHYRGLSRGGHGAHLLALGDLEHHKGVTVLRAQWAKASAGVKNSVRLAGLTGALEVVNFLSLLSKEDKTDKDYGLLVASGMSMAGTYAIVAGAVNKELFESAGKSFGNAKAVGSALGGVATLIGVVFDVKAVREQFQERNSSRVIAYSLKAIAGSVVSGSQLLTAFAYSAPVLQRAIGNGRTITFLTNVRHGIEGADEIRKAAAAGRALAPEAVKRGALVGVGRWVMWLGGWQVAVAVTAIQALVWALSPNALEEWCEGNHFGRKPKYKTLRQQADAFAKAIVEVRIAPPEPAP